MEGSRIEFMLEIVFIDNIELSIKSQFDVSTLLV
jgi:hypothetical protein